MVLGMGCVYAISFYQKESIPSKLAIGSDHATTLNPQEAIVMLDYHEYKIKTPEFDTENIDKYINHLIPKFEVKKEVKDTVHILKSENIPSNMTWQQYLAGKNKVIDYNKAAGQHPKGRKKGVLKDVDTK